jgi:hypothetical protein
MGLITRRPTRRETPIMFGIPVKYNTLSNIWVNEKATEYCAIYMNLLPFVEIGALGGE